MIGRSGSWSPNGWAVQRWCLVSLAMVLVWAVAGLGQAEEPFPQAAPEDLGLILPQGVPPKPGNDRRALVRNLAGGTVVGKVHVEVGDRFVMLLPNGRLLSVPQREATITDRPFVPASKDDLLEELMDKNFDGFKSRSTKRYLYVYNTSEAFYQATSRILETMYPPLFAYCKRQKIEVHDPEMPLVVLMFKTQEEFDKYRQMPQGVVAYYNGVTNYVVMYEQSRLAEVAPDLAVKQSISTIAHEGVHQVLHNIGVQQRLSRWPMWISEGLPEFFAPTDIGRRVRWKGVGLVNDLRLHEIVKVAPQINASSPDGKVVEQTVAAENLTSLGYAFSWGLVHYLARFQQDEFFDYLREVSQTGPLEKAPSVEMFQKHFGDEYSDLEEGLAKHLRSLPYVDPIANQTHIVAMADFGVRRSAIITTSPASVREFQQQVAGARFATQAFPNKAAAERFANAWLSGR